MGVYSTVAVGFRYPGPGSLVILQTEASGMPSCPAQSDLARFVSAISRLSLGEWEELHTRTLDLSPLFVPYVGHVVWGENYRRGEFMADLKGAQREAGVDPDGELPDHIEPILRYLDSGSSPLPDLLDVLPGAVEKMAVELKKADSDNPYRHLLAATSHLVGDLAAAGDSAPSGDRT